VYTEAGRSVRIPKESSACGLENLEEREECRRRRWIEECKASRSQKCRKERYEEKMPHV